MTQISETAYPVLRADVGPKELADAFRPTAEDLARADAFTQSPRRRVAYLIQLKVLQRLGYFPMLRDVPQPIAEFIALNSKFSRALTPEELSAFDRSSARRAAIADLRGYCRIRPVEKSDHDWLRAQAEVAAESMYLTFDIINKLLEDLVLHRFELPPFPLLDDIAQRARTTVNDRHCDALASRIKPAVKDQIDGLFDVPPGKSISNWQLLKREPKKPTGKEIRDYLQHVSWLKTLTNVLPPLDMPVAKLRHLQEWAARIDAGDMKRFKPNRRHALAAIFIKSRLSKAFDDVGDLLTRTLSNLENLAKKKLLEYQHEQQREEDLLVGQLREVVAAFMVEGPADKRIDAIDRTLIADPHEIIERCDALLAYSNRNHHPFLVSSYEPVRGQLFRCLNLVTIRSTTSDKSTELWIERLKSLRHSREATISLRDLALKVSDLDWIHDQLRDLVRVRPDAGRHTTAVHRKPLEIAILLMVKQELTNGDLYIEYGDEYRDWREEMVTPEEYATDIKSYGEIAGIETDGRKFVTGLKQRLIHQALEVDRRWPANDHVQLINGRLSVSRLKKQERPEKLQELDRLIGEQLPKIGILEVFSDVGRWLDLPKLFKSLSGVDSKVKDLHTRFVLTSVCYGCNLGPTQTARSTVNLSRKQIAWINNKNVSERLLERASTMVINQYSAYDLTKFWGGGFALSVDGTKWDLYEQNLFSQFHIRYGGYGGLGYYAVLDNYIAFYSRFNTCGSHESNYMLDWFMSNQTDVHPKRVHGDTHSQNYAGYALAFLLGIELMPRIKGLSKLEFYRPSKDIKLSNINELFSDTVDWDLIEKHLPDMLKVIFSLRRGKILASTVLRRIGTHSRKNKLYSAFRALGSAIRTLFLLRYIDDLTLRHTVHAASNKSEEFNAFIKWLFFGTEGTIAENVRSEQQKMVRWGAFAANMVMLYNVDQMTRVIDQLRKENFEITPELLEGLSPYRGAHINRFGKYDPMISRAPLPMATSMPWIKPRSKILVSAGGGSK